MDIHVLVHQAQGLCARDEAGVASVPSACVWIEDGSGKQVGSQRVYV